MEKKVNNDKYVSFYFIPMLNNIPYIYSEEELELFLRMPDYFKTHTVEEIREQEVSFWNDYFDERLEEEKKKLEQDDQTVTVTKYGKRDRDREISKRTNVVLGMKKFFDSMTEEELKMYMDYVVTNSKIEIKMKNLNSFDGDEIYSAVTNVRYMTENEKSFKNHFKSVVKNMVADNTHYGYIVFPGIITILSEAIQEATGKDVVPAAVMFSISLATMIAITGIDVVKKWFDKVKSNPDDVKILKEAGLYDLLLEKIDAEQKYVQLKRKRG